MACSCSGGSSSDKRSGLLVLGGEAARHDLCGLDVRLIERIHSEHCPGDSRRKLPSIELGAEGVPIGPFDPHDGCPARSSRSTAASAAASGRRGERRWTKTRSRPYTSGGPATSPSIGMIPLPMLAERFGDELLEPCTEARQAGGAISVGLSRPASASSPSTTPSSNAGIVRTGRRAALRHRRARDRAASRDRRPSSAAGTRPKFESAE